MPAGHKGRTPSSSRPGSSPSTSARTHGLDRRSRKRRYVAAVGASVHKCCSRSLSHLPITVSAGGTPLRALRKRPAVGGARYRDHDGRERASSLRKADAERWLDTSVVTSPRQTRGSASRSGALRQLRRAPCPPPAERGPVPRRQGGLDLTGEPALDRLLVHGAQHRSWKSRRRQSRAACSARRVRAAPSATVDTRAPTPGAGLRIVVTEDMASSASRRRSLLPRYGGTTRARRGEDPASSTSSCLPSCQLT